MRPHSGLHSPDIAFAVRLVRGVGQRCRRGGYGGAFRFACMPPAGCSPTSFAALLDDDGLPVVDARDAISSADMLRRICGVLGNGVRVTNAGWQRAIIDIAHAWRDHDAPCVAILMPGGREFVNAAAMLSHTARMPLIVLGDAMPAESSASIIDLETDDDRAELARSLFQLDCQQPAQGNRTPGHGGYTPAKLGRASAERPRRAGRFVESPQGGIRSAFDEGSNDG